MSYFLSVGVVALILRFSNSLISYLSQVNGSINALYFSVSPSFFAAKAMEAIQSRGVESRLMMLYRLLSSSVLCPSSEFRGSKPLAKCPYLSLNSFQLSAVRVRLTIFLLRIWVISLKSSTCAPSSVASGPFFSSNSFWRLSTHSLTSSCSLPKVALSAMEIFWVAKSTTPSGNSLVVLS